MAAIGLPLQRPNGGLEARPGEDFHMTDPGGLTRSNNRGVDWGDGAEASIENEKAPCAKPNEGVGDPSTIGMFSTPEVIGAVTTVVGLGWSIWRKWARA